MGATRLPEPVQPLIGIILNPAEDAEGIRARIRETFGDFDLVSPVWPFEFTDYYAKSMGTGLLRQFVALRDLASPEGLHRMKLRSNAFEEEFAAKSTSGVTRPVNLDPGYMCHSKLVLFSTKDFSHRLYVGDGIYAESTLEWRGGDFIVHPWTFPDYRTRHYREFMKEVRGLYVGKLALRGTPDTLQ